MTNKIHKQNSGFTIIEVLIVLAIAGLILLIVFLAVPALQRNSRNTSYRSEASQLLGATTEFSNNNDGKIPGTVVSQATDATSIVALTKNKNITALKIEVQGAVTAPTLAKATLQTGAKCNGASTSVGATRQVALVYAIEDASGNATAQCIDA